MFCKYCGKQITSDSVFCKYCGQSLVDSESIPEIKSKNEPLPVLTETKKAEGKQKNLKGPIILISVAALVILGVILYIFVFNSEAPGASNVKEEPLAGTEIAKLSDSVLMVNVYDKNGELLGTGSGFIVFDDNTLVTNYHVIDQAYRIEAVSEKDVHYSLSGVVYLDDKNDIAILKFETATKLPVLEIADSDQVSVGDEVYAIGSPLGLKNTVSNGIVSAIRPEGQNKGIQITAPISPGSSGGALLNIYGKIIGITYGGYESGQNLNLVIPSNLFISAPLSTKVSSFAEISLIYNHIGNSYSNYSSGANIAEYERYVYHCYNSDSQIIKYNMDTHDSEETGLYGTDLSIYHGILYFVSKSGNAISTYDLSTHDYVDNILLNYDSSARVNSIKKLLITDYGITIVYEVGFLDNNLIQLDFEGNVIGTYKDSPVLIDNGLIVNSKYDTWELEFVSLIDMSSFSVKLGFRPDSVYYCGDGFLYISDSTRSDYTDLVKYNINTGACENIEKRNGNTQGCYIYSGKIFYLSTTGTNVMSVSGTGVKCISNYFTSSIGFSSDGKLYGIATALKDDFIEPQHTEYFVRMNLDGSELEILDEQYIDFIN